MCVIAVCQSRRLTDAEVDKMQSWNPHGIGIAWPNRKEGRVEYVKGLTPEEAIALIPRLPLPQIVHFRFASVGAVGPDLCHPFAIDRVPDVSAEGHAPRVLFHNGTWLKWKVGFEAVRDKAGLDPAASPDGWSDTRVMAALMAAYSPEAVAEIVGDGQRLAIMHANGRVQTFGAFAKHKGLLVSNLYWSQRPLIDESTIGYTAPKVKVKALKPKGKVVAKAGATSNGSRKARWSPKDGWRPEQCFLINDTTPLATEAPAGKGTTRSKPRVPRPAWPDRGWWVAR